MNKLAYLILSVMNDMGAFSKMSSITANDICFEIKESNYSYSAVYKKLRWLMENGKVAAGIKDGNSNTYFITKSGIELLENISNEGG